MDSNTSLLRDSVYFYNRDKVENKSPIVVVGPARGGTSMVATVLESLGYYLGEGAKAPVFESTDDSRVFLGNSHKAAVRLVKNRSETRELWAWKRPEAIRNLKKIERRLQPGAYLFVFRDPLATAIRRSKSSHGVDETNLAFVVNHLRQVSTELETAINFARKTKKPLALISYDSALLNPEEFVAKLAAFLDLDLNPEIIRNAASKITPSPIKYLTETRSSIFEGRLDVVRQNVVHGWARITNVEGPCEVEIRHNGELVAVVTAGESRMDLERKGLGNFAFSHQFENSVSVGDVISARILGDDLDLINSPYVVKDM